MAGASICSLAMVSSVGVQQGSTLLLRLKTCGKKFGGSIHGQGRRLGSGPDHPRLHRHLCLLGRRMHVDRNGKNTAPAKLLTEQYLLVTSPEAL